MKGKDFLITAMALAAIGAVSLLAYRHVTRPREELCQVCQRPVHHGMNYRLEMADGTSEVACCPRCGMHFEVSRPGAVRAAEATDLASGRVVPAKSAYYVEGGDIEYCTMHSNPVQREPEGVSVREYDRCLPALVAFRTRAEAASYRARHGGRILDYGQALESVKQR